MPEGIALFRPDERVSAKLQEFPAVEKRAQELLKPGLPISYNFPKTRH